MRGNYVHQIPFDKRQATLSTVAVPRLRMKEWFFARLVRELRSRKPLSSRSVTVRGPLAKRHAGK